MFKIEHVKIEHDKIEHDKITMAQIQVQNFKIFKYLVDSRFALHHHHLWSILIL